MLSRLLLCHSLPVCCWRNCKHMIQLWLVCQAVYCVICTISVSQFVVSSSGKSLLKAVRKGRATSRQVLQLLGLELALQLWLHAHTCRKRSRQRSEDAGSEASSRTSSRGPSRASSRQPSIGHATTSFHSLPVSSRPSAAPHVERAPVSKPPPASKHRVALLNQIHTGTKLKKSMTSDRSAPRV